MTRKYCKIKTINDYPVTAPQIRQLARDAIWAFCSRMAEIGHWGRLAGDPPASIAGTATTRVLTAVSIDATVYNQIYFGVVVDGSGTATWSIELSLNDGASWEVEIILADPGTADGDVSLCSLSPGQVRACVPLVRVTRTSGTGTLALRYIGLWGYRSDPTDYGPANGAPAASADLQTALDLVSRLLQKSRPMIGWFGDHTLPISAAVALRWYALGNKIDADKTAKSTMTAACLVYQLAAAAGQTWTLKHTQNEGPVDVSETRGATGTGTHSEVGLTVEAQSYSTATPWSGGKLDASAWDAAKRPVLRALQLLATPTDAVRVAIMPTSLPFPDWQIRTVEAARAVGINTIAQAIHLATWYAGGNHAGGMAAGAGKLYTVSTDYVTIFDGLIWVRDDACSGAAAGTNVYQVAIRAENGGTAVDMTVRLTVGGQTGTSLKAFAAGENYLTFDPSLSSINIDGYAFPCKVEIKNSVSRETTVFSVHISRRGGAY